MRVIVNGEARNFTAPLSVLGLLQDLCIDSRKVALERNLEIVARSDYAGTHLDDGDRLEIVHFIGGGDEKKPASAEAAEYLVIAGLWDFLFPPDTDPFLQKNMFALQGIDTVLKIPGAW